MPRRRISLIAEPRPTPSASIPITAIAIAGGEGIQDQPPPSPSPLPFLGGLGGGAPSLAFADAAALVEFLAKTAALIWLPLFVLLFGL